MSIQNQLLPGCAVKKLGAGSNEWVELIYDPNLTYNGILHPIPLTPDTVSRVEGIKESDGGVLYFDQAEGVHYRRATNTVILDNVRALYHIKSIHQLQILIFSLTGEMPKYELR